MGWTPVWEDVLAVFNLVNVAFSCGFAGHEFVTSHNEVLRLKMEQTEAAARIRAGRCTSHAVYWC
ncbi:hypothetical protein HMPREF3160_03975 [Arthrobacter sp. HMSC06H05]|nr:hypothetical protein HMPREF3175_02705 [Arthrobacter sp. HMSC08H08]OFT43063.1 hypothetical protein HMPREF3160_03975 [Arthrobacter sp. HMSC06H05]